MTFSPISRRTFIRSSFCFSAWYSTPGLMAEVLTFTPEQTEGPFYPDNMPLDTNNDLIIINDSLTPAVGTIAYLSGKITDARGVPVRNALVEIWQVDHRGIYLHRDEDGSGSNFDSNFQGYGTFLTDVNGRYFFRTIKPSPYTGRTPHIHFAVSLGGVRHLTTQCYVRGEPRNKRDFILNKIKDPKARNSLIVPFIPIKDSKLGETNAVFDIVLGWTPKD